MGIGSWLYTNSKKNLRVKIVHPGGHAELHDRPLLASDIIRRNPKCCVAHPNIFKQPWAIVQPDTMLVPGQKVFVVPVSTVRKLQKASLKKSGLSGHEGGDGNSVEKSGDDGDSDVSCCSMEESDTICVKSFSGGDEAESGQNCFSCGGSKRKAGMTKGVAPSNKGDERNGKNVGSPGKLISDLEYWQPSLHSIVEERSNISGVEEERNKHHSIVEEKNVSVVEERGIVVVEERNKQ